MKEYGELILCNIAMPLDSYEYKCLKVDYDGTETEVYGGDIHDQIESIKGWKKQLTPLEVQNKELKEEVKKLESKVESLVSLVECCIESMSEASDSLMWKSYEEKLKDITK